VVGAVGSIEGIAEGAYDGAYMVAFEAFQEVQLEA